MKPTVYLCEEIHSSWREECVETSITQNLPGDFLTPVTMHEACENVDANILGSRNLGIGTTQK